MRRLLPALPVLALAAVVASAGGDKVTLRTAKLPELEKAIQGFKGKVVVVDLWSTT